MPNGRIHAINTAMLTVASIGAIPVLVGNYGLSMWALPLGAFSGILISPDLDVDGGNESDFIIRKKFGTVPQALWRVFWFAYSKLVPHRSAISHFPILGTTIRVGYILFPLFLVELFFNANIVQSAGWLVIQPWFKWWFIGLCLADLWHTILDVIL